MTYHPTREAVSVGAVADLAPHIPAPVAGEAARLEFSSVAGYTGTVVWKAGPEYAGALSESVFQTETAYRAEVTVYAVPGYVLREQDTKFVYSGGGELNGAGEWKWSAYEDGQPDGHSVTGLRIDFPETAGVMAVPVTDLDLTFKVPAPYRGGTPALYVSAPQYAG